MRVDDNDHDEQEDGDMIMEIKFMMIMMIKMMMLKMMMIGMMLELSTTLHRAFSK